MQIYLMMQHKKNLRIKELAEEFGVDKRTIYRDLRYLRDLNVPITHDPEEGYGIMRDAHIKPLMFTNREIAIIMMGLSFLKSQVDKEMVEDAIRAENKIANALPASLREFMSTIEKSVIVDPHVRFKLEKKAGGNWFLLLSAIANKVGVTFAYTNRKGEHAPRSIDPLVLVYFTDHWNVIGFCHTTKEIRNFILDAMSDVGISDKPRTYNQTVDSKHLLYERSGESEIIEVEVDAAIWNNFFRLLPVQIRSSEENKHKVYVQFMFDNIAWLSEWLLQFGTGISIISPEPLRESYRNRLKTMLEKTKG